ncbi:MAG: acyltransferase [Bacteroidaceae bacterium]|nr:acyltransferase [Bacteroidaceae bacterium]
MNRQQTTSKVLACLRTPLIVGVVMLHANLYNLVTQWSGEAPLWPAWLVFYFRNIVNILFPSCVAIFFLLAGYFFFTGEQKRNIAYFRDKLRRRVQTLLVPYLLWNTLALLLFYIKSSDFLGGLSQQSGEDFSFAKYLTGYWAFYFSGDIPANGPLWFVRDLMVVSLLSPLLYQLLRNRWLGVISLLVLFVCVSCGAAVDIHGVDFYSILFFSIGAWLRLQRIDIQNVPKRVGVAAIALYFPISCFMFNLCDSPVYVALSLVATLIKFVALIYLIAQLYSSRLLVNIPKLSQRSFFVYAFHGLIIGPVIKALYIMSGATENPILLVLISVFSVAVVIFMCNITYTFTERRLPSLHKLLSGGR